MRLVTTGTMPQRVQTWNSAVRVPNVYRETREGSLTTTFSAPPGLEVQTPPCLVQNEQLQARAGISPGSGSQVSEKAMFPQWHLPCINMDAPPLRRPLTPLLRRLIACGRLRAGPEEELLHFRLKELARLGLDRRQPVLVDEHGLVLQPARPAFPGDTLVDAPAELTWIRGPLESRGLALQKNTLHHA